MKQRSSHLIEHGHPRPTLDRNKLQAAANKLLPKQLRKQLGKHYANKYRAGRG